MAQFDLHRLANGHGLVLNCQSDLLDHIDSRFVVPLLPVKQAPPPVTRLNPVFQVDGADYVMLTQSAGAIRRRDLGPAVASLADRHVEIVDAIDVLLSGV
ncbi:CcdB family protein [Novosphingobium naphthalenivorans]|uniref:CcdB family protein n=1 Tax=Novosphingobium naphthalenivorans TaxID=273168 RepID=UPI000834AF6D|nr:CcdB family protein [Novosphingobium naphthalenivorans]